MILKPNYFPLQLIREAVAASLPVARDQLLTIQIPGTIIDTRYVLNLNNKPIHTLEY